MDIRKELVLTLAGSLGWGILGVVLLCTPGYSVWLGIGALLAGILPAASALDKAFDTDTVDKRWCL